MEGKFGNKLFVNIVYSLVITSIIEIFLVNNLYKILYLYIEINPEKRPVMLLVKQETLIVLVFILMGMGIFSFILWLFQRKELIFIDRLSKGVEEIASGDLNAKIEVSGDSEFSEIADKLNAMVVDLRNLMKKERESEEKKNELITSIAHDLRTPLTSIIGYLELLKQKKDIDEETRAYYTDIAYTKAKKMQKLIEDLFGFTKLNHRRITMNVSRIDIVKLLSQLVDEFYPSFLEKKLAFDLKTNVSSKFINADPNLLARLFDNLINNAIKYGSDGKRVDVKIEASKDEVIVSVINYGEIIPKDEIPYIFEKFYRVEQSRSSSTGGTGLGLAIAKEIVDMHGGSLSVKSDFDGTVFSVRLKADFDIDKENIGSN
jgi:integral membrane sensor signal transduction histidine kinase